ncbi:MAG: efflux RND transporter periplasmic adaptor subunit [Akkermansiaceae bacterium]|nr:efflux RND transporter periplasmic adaptor subunit [Armatimonadota bacterium]
MSTITAANPRKPHGKWWIALGAITALAAGLVVFPVVPRRPASEIAPGITKPVLTIADGEAGKAGDVSITDEAMELAEITIAPVRRQVVNEKLALSGVIQTAGDRLAKMTPRVAGKVKSVSAVVGDDVRAGQTLALIESGELARAQAALAQAEGRLAAARSNLARQQQLAKLGAFGGPAVEDARTKSVDAEQLIHDAQHHLQTERAELAEARSQQRALIAQIGQAQTQAAVVTARAERADTLFKEELTSRQDWEQARAEQKKAEADVEVARANAARGESTIRGAETQVDAAEGEYKLAQRRARIASEGRARQEKVYTGGFATSKELVEAESAVRLARLDLGAAAQSVRLLGGTPGGGNVVAVTSPISGRVQERAVTLGETVDTEHSLFTVVNLDSVVAEFQVAPRDMPRMRTGSRVELFAEGAPGKTFAGRIVSVGTTTNEETRAVPVRVVVANRGGTLRPGTFVRGSALTDTRRAQVVVPPGAIQEHTGKKTLYVASGDKRGDFEVRHVLLGAASGDGWREVSSGLSGDERIAVSGTFYLKSEALKDSLSDGCCAVDTKE